MKKLRRIIGKLPYSANRRKVLREMEALWALTPLPKSSRQSSGPLYEKFLSNDQKDLHKWHHYFDIYQRHLSRYVGKPVRFLEIGVFRGGSLRMWRDYLGAEAVIVGADIDTKCAEFDGIHGSVRIGDQSDTNFLAQICEEFGPFDVVIDDGGHLPSQQIASFSFLYPLVSDHGVYICEDTHTNYWKKNQDLGSKLTFMNLAKDISDHLTEPHFRGIDGSRFKASNWERFSTEPEKRIGDLRVSYVAASTHSVHFYDSVVVFERRPRPEPFLEIR